jgi:cell wall-associated NlpC family hydrolase
MTTCNDNPHFTRNAIIAEARSWVGTPYLHMGRRKGVGCDCATFIAEVFHAVGLISQVQIDGYAPFWHLHRSEERYLTQVLDYAVEFNPMREPPLPGDIALWRYGRTYSHGAIIVSWPEIIEANMVRGIIVNHACEHQGKLVRLFRCKAFVESTVPA